MLWERRRWSKTNVGLRVRDKSAVGSEVVKGDDKPGPKGVSARAVMECRASATVQATVMIASHELPESEPSTCPAMRSCQKHSQDERRLRHTLVVPPKKSPACPPLSESQGRRIRNSDTHLSLVHLLPLHLQLALLSLALLLLLLALLRRLHFRQLRGGRGRLGSVLQRQTSATVGKGYARARKRDDASRAARSEKRGLCCSLQGRRRDRASAARAPQDMRERACTQYAATHLLAVAVQLVHLHLLRGAVVIFAFAALALLRLSSSQHKV